MKHPLIPLSIRTGSDGRLRYTIAQRGERLGAFDRSGMSTMAFSRQHGISYQTFIAWLRKRRQSGEALPPCLPAFAEVMLQQPPPPASSASLRSFLRYLVAMREPDLLAQTQQVLAIPFKRHTRPLLGVLTLTEINNILRSTSGSRAGRRDHALFLFLYNTGARVSEAINARVKDVQSR